MLSPLDASVNSTTQFIIAFTKNGNTQSNAPLQSLQW